MLTVALGLFWAFVVYVAFPWLALQARAFWGEWFE